MKLNNGIPFAAALVVAGLSGCGESNDLGTLEIKIVEREDYTYSAGYGNGCRFKVELVNNTDQPVSRVEAFVMDGEEYLFSVSGELPVNGSTTRSHDVQKNKRCNEIGKELKLQKNTCELGAMPEADCFALIQIVPPDA